MLSPSHEAEMGSVWDVFEYGGPFAGLEINRVLIDRYH